MGVCGLFIWSWISYWSFFAYLILSCRLGFTIFLFFIIPLVIRILRLCKDSILPLLTQGWLIILRWFQFLLHFQLLNDLHFLPCLPHCLILPLIYSYCFVQMVVTLLFSVTLSFLLINHIRCFQIHWPYFLHCYRILQQILAV